MFVFFLVIMVIADFQVIALFYHNMERFVQTNDKKYKTSAKRWLAGTVGTLASTFVIAAHILHTFMESFRADF